MHAVVGLDVCGRGDEERVQILRVGWEIGWLVIHQNLEKERRCRLQWQTQKSQTFCANEKKNECKKRKKNYKKIKKNKKIEIK